MDDPNFKIRISGNGMEVTDSMRSAIEGRARKLLRLVEMIDGDASVKVEGHGQIKFEVSLNKSSPVIRASAVGPDFYDLVDKVFDQIERQIGRYRINKSSKHIKSIIKALDSAEEADSSQESRIASSKIIMLDSISEEDAIQYLELINYDFYVFRDIDRDNKVCVVYRKYNGGYGLLETR
jgi:putative sigma-54 modulation protein